MSHNTILHSHVCVYVLTLTGTDVRFVTESIMIRSNRSYKWPVARENTWILLSSSADTTAVWEGGGSVCMCVRGRVCV